MGEAPCRSWAPAHRTGPAGAPLSPHPDRNPSPTRPLPPARRPLPSLLSSPLACSGLTAGTPILCCPATSTTAPVAGAATLLSPPPLPSSAPPPDLDRGIEPPLPPPGTPPPWRCRGARAAHPPLDLGARLRPGARSRPHLRSRALHRPGAPESWPASSVIVRLVVFTHWIQQGATATSASTSSSSSASTAPPRRSARLRSSPASSSLPCNAVSSTTFPLRPPPGFVVVAASFAVTEPAA